MFFALNTDNDFITKTFRVNDTQIEWSQYIWFVVIFVLGGILFLALLKVAKKNIRNNSSLKVKSIRFAEKDYIPLYLSYFLIALEVPGLISVGLIALGLIYFIYKTKLYFFNPYFLIDGYHFYNVLSDKNIEITIISKKNNIKEIKEFTNLYKLNEFTFLDEKGLNDE